MTKDYIEGHKDGSLSVTKEIVKKEIEGLEDNMAFIASVLYKSISCEKITKSEFQRLSNIMLESE